MTIDFDTYQKQTNSFALYPKEDPLISLSYLTLGLTGESGEVAEVLKKLIRKRVPISEILSKDPEAVHDDHVELRQKTREHLASEMGDVLWYLAQLAEQCGFSLQDIAHANILKLAERQRTNTIQKLD